jgi:hypothetical protein
MPNNTFEVTVIDLWPKLKLLIKQGSGFREEGPKQYDVALSDFTPAVDNALRLAVESIINQRKGRQQQ